MAEALVVAGAVALVAVTWVFLFRTDVGDLGARTWVAAALLASGAVAGAAALGRTETLLGPVSVTEVLIGAGVGLIWVVATHVGAAVLGRIAPSFLGQTADLYHVVGRAPKARLVGPLVALAVAEELLFRGLIQAEAGLPLAIGVYAAVQLVEGKWPLVLAAVLGGLLWGGLYWWRDGLVAPSVAHAVWTVALALIWPVRPGLEIRRPD